ALDGTEAQHSASSFRLKSELGQSQIHPRQHGQLVSRGRATKRELPSRSTRTSTFLRPCFLAPETSGCRSSGLAIAERPTATRRSPARRPWAAPALFCATSRIMAPFTPSDSENCLRSSGVSLASLRPSASTAAGDLGFSGSGGGGAGRLGLSAATFSSPSCSLPSRQIVSLTCLSGGVSATRRGNYRLRSIGLPS